MTNASLEFDFTPKLHKLCRACNLQSEKGFLAVNGGYLVSLTYM